MNYNLKVTKERIRGKYNVTVEVSGPGRAGVLHATTDTFDESLAAEKKLHDELFGQVKAYHDASIRPAPEVQPAAADAGDGKQKSHGAGHLGTKKHKAAQKALNQEVKAKLEAAGGEKAAKAMPTRKKPAARNFAAD